VFDRRRRLLAADPPAAASGGSAAAASVADESRTAVHMWNADRQASKLISPRPARSFRRVLLIFKIKLASVRTSTALIILVKTGH
jgi:hypothetical protein